jgi:hypothetical protein
MLEPARNELGRIGVAIAGQVNAQHREGMDLAGAMGGNFFNIGAATATPATANTGGAIGTLADGRTSAFEHNIDGVRRQRDHIGPEGHPRMDANGRRFCSIAGDDSKLGNLELFYIDLVAQVCGIGKRRAQAARSGTRGRGKAKVRSCGRKRTAETPT